MAAPPAYPKPMASTAELACARCGYLLRGLSGIARCPECGLEIDASLRHSELRFADPIWVDRLAIGVQLALIAHIGLMAASGAMVLHASIDAPSLGVIYQVEGAAYAAFWAGAMLLALPRRDPVLPETNPRALTALRVCVSIYTAAHFVRFALPPNARAAAFVIWCIGNVFHSLTLCLFYLRLRELARGVADAFLIRQSIVVMVMQVFVQTLVLVQQMPWLPGARSPTREMIDPTLSRILWWIVAIYTVPLLWRARRKFAAARAAAFERWQLPANVR